MQILLIRIRIINKKNKLQVIVICARRKKRIWKTHGNSSLRLLREVSGHLGKIFQFKEDNPKLLLNLIKVNSVVVNYTKTNQVFFI